MPKYIRIVSDLHLDFDVPENEGNFLFKMLWMPPSMKEDKDTILLLAGDVWHARKMTDFNGRSWIKELAKNFYAVIVVLGNHDFWGGALPKEYDLLEDDLEMQGIKNVFVLQNKTIKFGKLKLVGGTLWTNYNNMNEKSLAFARFGFMRDYDLIKSGFLGQKLSPALVHKEHVRTLNFIRKHSKKDQPGQYVWVVTHHPPSFKSVVPRMKAEGMMEERSLYASDLESVILNHKDIIAWVHGHSHIAQDYNIGNTRILSNPRGYLNEDTGFNPWLRFLPNGTRID